MVLDLLWNWLTVTIAAVVLGYAYLTWNDNYWKKRNVAFPKPKLLFGNYMDVILSRRTVGELMEEIYNKFDGKSFVGFWRFRTPGIMVRDPEVIKSVLMKDFSYFEENGFALDPNLDPLFARNPFFRSGEAWKTMRTLLSPSFTSVKLKPLMSLMEEVNEEFVQLLRTTINSPDGVEAKALSLQYTVEMVARCAFGIRGNALEDPNSKLRVMVNRIMEPGFWKNMEIMILNFVPFIGSLLQVSWIPKDVDTFFRKIISDVVEHRRKNDVTRKDFLQYLIDMRKKSMETGGAYTDEDVMGNAITFMMEGSETSAITLSFTIYQLARNPEVQEALRQETEEKRRECGGKLTYEAIMDLPLLDQVMQEALRMHAPLMTMEKICSRDFTLRGSDGSECRVKKGMLVAVPVQALHYDPRYFPDPERFDPGRWAPERRDQITKYTYLPFGEGPRICIGMRFAQLQVKMALAKLLQHFDIQMTTRTPRRIVQDPTYFLSCAKGGLWLGFHERKGVS